LIPIQLVQTDQTVELTARLDTGSQYCFFDRSFAEILGLDPEGGARINVRTVRGDFIAYGQEVTLRTLGLEWSAVVYFYAAPTPQSNFLGRIGWLDQLRLGVIDYDQRLLLASYDTSDIEQEPGNDPLRERLRKIDI
jgi:hypothetical protein